MLLLLLACVDPSEETAPPCCKSTDDSAVDTDSAPPDSAVDSSPDDSAPPDTSDTADIPPPPVPPKVILFIGDGMGPEHIEGGGLYANGAVGSLTMETLPNQGHLVTASLTGVTDSAAGATALGSGVKTWNDWVAVDRDNLPVTTLLELARSRGLAGGLVTTDTLLGATPAAFYAHYPSRYATDELASQFIAGAPELALGGGAGVLDPLLETVDYQHVSTRDELLAASLDGRPLVGTFADFTFPYLSDGYVTEPSLSEMTTFALDALDADPDGFFLMVEGARIDHASHANREESVHLETAAFDEAIATALAWAEGKEGVTVVVTADHECGGMQVTGESPAGEIPDTTWRWGSHTNADVRVFGTGGLTSTFADQRLDNTWVHAVLSAAILGSTSVTAPETSLLVDGRTDDLGAPVVTQTWDTSFGLGYNQLDAMRVTADAEGLWVGLDGIFELGANSEILLLDVDYGQGTGLGADGTTIEDTDGAVDSVLTAMPYTSGVEGMGFDVALVGIEGEEMALDELSDVSGLRGLRAPWVNDATDLWWLRAQTNFDDGNVSHWGTAPDAGATGMTENGWEIRVPWESLYPDGLPPEGLSVALVAVIANSEGSYASNQALPPLPDADEPGSNPVLLESAVLLQVDGSGTAIAPAVVVP